MFTHFVMFVSGVENLLKTWKNRIIRMVKKIIINRMVSTNIWKLFTFFWNFSEKLVMHDLHTSDTNILNACEYFGVEWHARVTKKVFVNMHDFQTSGTGVFSLARFGHIRHFFLLSMGCIHLARVCTFCKSCNLKNGH